MTHDEQVQQWYTDRAAALNWIRIEADKRTQEKEWLRGENAQTYVAQELAAWVEFNPFPIKHNE